MTRDPKEMGRMLKKKNGGGDFAKDFSTQGGVGTRAQGMGCMDGGGGVRDDAEGVESGEGILECAVEGIQFCSLLVVLVCCLFWYYLLLRFLLLLFSVRFLIFF